ncbi:MAG: ABC transporter ATP-binding protein [Acidimicrobiaceae bacterium]|jgi:ATP-binding cassette subfamily B protein|nr:ABC transporter ATP-binding protein [Acidimicrobiaceae bacterium]
MPRDNATFEPVRDWSTYPPVQETIRSDGSLGWLKRISPVVLTHRWRILWSVVAALVAMVAQILVPRVIGLAIDRSLINRTSGLWFFMVFLLILGVARAAATFGYRYGLYGMAFKVEYQLRTLLFQHLGKLSFSFFDRVQSGQIISRANSDIRSVQMFMAFAPIMAVQFFSFVVAIGLMAAISVPLTAITMIALPGVFAIGQRLRKIMFPLSWVIQSRQAEIATVVDESVNGVRVVKAFAAERHQIESLARGAERLRWANMVQHWTRASHTPFIENLPRVALAVVLLVGGLQTIDGSLTVGELVSFNLYILLLQAPFRFIGMLLILGQRAKASAERIYEILDEVPAVVDRHGAVDLVPSGGHVTFSDVSFAYGTEIVGGTPGKESAPLVLDRFTLDIPAGQTVAIVGRTGSGKSTIARLLMRFYDVQGGCVSVDGHDIASVTQTSLRAAVSLVPDEPFLFSTSVHDNIAYGKPGASRQEVEAAAIAAQAHEFILDLEHGYDTVVGERGYDLSGGQRQRISLARLFLSDPQVIVLDDSTSAIDVEIEERIHGSLSGLMRERTTIVIAHRLSTIALADRVVLVEGGRVVADGTHQQLLDGEPRYVETLAASLGEDSW